MGRPFLERLARHFLTFLFFGILCGACLVLFGEGDRFWTGLWDFPLSVLTLLLGLAFLNYILRFLRWQGLLRILGIRIRAWRSFEIFMAGLTMTITPGKVGEALKAHLIRGEGDYPWADGLSVVFVERVLDLEAVVLLVGIGMLSVRSDPTLGILGMALCVAMLVVLLHPKLIRKAAGVLTRYKRTRALGTGLQDMHGNIRRLLVPSSLIPALSLSVLAWFSECLVLYGAMWALSLPPQILEAVFTYAFATLAGVLSPLPGGLVATDGSMTGLLLLQGLERDLAALLTFIVRLCTLWFGVLVGMVFLWLVRRRQRESGSPKGPPGTSEARFSGGEGR